MIQKNFKLFNLSTLKETDQISTFFGGHTGSNFEITLLPVRKLQIKLFFLIVKHYSKIVCGCHINVFVSLFPDQVIDRSGGQTSELFDDSKVEKFELSDEAYEQRKGTNRTHFSPLKFVPKTNHGLKID